MSNKEQKLLDEAFHYWYSEHRIDYGDLTPDLYSNDDADRKYASLVLTPKTDKKTLRCLAIGFLASANESERRYKKIMQVPDRYKIIEKKYHELASRYNRLVAIAKENMSDYYPIDLDKKTNLPF